MTEKNIDAIYENISQDVKDMVDLGFYSKEEVCGVECEPFKPYIKRYSCHNVSDVKNDKPYKMPKKIFILVIIFILVCLSAFHFVQTYIDYTNQYTEHYYNLDEIDDGVYVMYYNTNSAAPAYNYEVATVCCNGNIVTFKGSVNISFVDNDHYVKVKNYNTVNSDEINIYVPKGTVDYRDSVSIGSGRRY